MRGRNRASGALAAGVEAVAVDSPEDARDYILHHPRVLALEAEGMRRLHEIQPAGALTEGLATFPCERLPGPSKIGRASCREKRVSVRVDLGGSRIIKKQRKKN